MKELLLILLVSTAVFSGAYIVLNQPKTEPVVLTFRISSFKEQLRRDRVLEFSVLPQTLESRDGTPLAENGASIFAAVEAGENSFAVVTGLYKDKEALPESCYAVPCIYRGVTRRASRTAYHRFELPFRNFELREQVTAKGRRIIESKMNHPQKTAGLVVSIDPGTAHYSVRDLVINNKSVPEIADKNGYFIRQTKEGNYTADSIHFSVDDRKPAEKKPETPAAAPAPVKKPKGGLLSILE